jgi:NADPH2 dehydrogenase
MEQWGDQGPIILAGGYSPQSAATAVDEEHKDRDVLIAFVRYAIAVE